MSNQPPNLIAFAHIHKNAGMSLIHILRRNFFMRYMDVRPLNSDSERVFCASDLSNCYKLNPFLNSVGGHSVKVYSNLHKIVPQTKYLVLFRDPIKRYLSQWLYNNAIYKRNKPFEEFLKNPQRHNQQTQEFAGEPNLDRATELLATRVWLAGTVKEFDAFLLMLQQKLRPFAFKPYYKRTNTSQQRKSSEKEQKGHILQKYGDEIRERNQIDLKLYAKVQELIQRQKSDFSGDLEAEINQFRTDNRATPQHRLKDYLDYAVRKLYYYPATGLRRIQNGLNYHGTY